MQKKSAYEKRKTTIIFLHDLDTQVVPEHSLQLVTSLKKTGYILIHPGQNYELTAKGRALAGYFSDSPDAFRKNIQKSLAPKEQKLSSGTMPLFRDNCKECKKQKKLHAEWVKADCQAINDGTARPVYPKMSEHSHA